MRTSSGQQRVDVEVEDSSWREGRGVRHTAWSLRVNDAWVRVKDLHDVRYLQANPEFSFADDVDQRHVLPSGCEWSRTYLLSLPLGARLHQHVSYPLPDPPQRHSDAAIAGDVKALLRDFVANYPPLKPRLKVVGTTFRVAGFYRLVAEPKGLAERSDRIRRAG